MKIAVVGTGAMGSVYAGLLAAAGNEVWAIDTWREHIDAIRTRGLRVEGASGDRTVRLDATADASEPGPCDLVIIATKADGVGSAAASIKPLLRSDTLVLTIQNGLGAAERICRHLPPDNVLLGVAGGFGASIRGPGHAHHNGMELIRLGELGGGITERLERIGHVWRDAGFNVRCFEDINQLVWEKFVCNVTFSGSCTIFECTIGGCSRTSRRGRSRATAPPKPTPPVSRRECTFRSTTPSPTFAGSARRSPTAARPCSRTTSRSEPPRSTRLTEWCPSSRGKWAPPAPYNEVVTAIVKAKELAFTVEPGQ